MNTRRELLKHAAGAIAGLAGAAAEPEKARAPVIDCHSHAGTGPALLSPWTTVADPEELLRNGKEAGIDQIVIFPITNDTYERANREIAEICRRYPGKFIGYAKHHATNEKGRIRSMLTYECRELGLRGLKLHPPHPGPEILDTVAELKIPMIYHAPEGKVALIDEMARDYPTVDIVIAHLGSAASTNWPEHGTAIEIAKRRPNVYLDTAAVLQTRFIEQAIWEVGAERVVFGSDAPDQDSRLMIYMIRMLKLPKEKEELILGGNMQRLLSKSRGLAG